MNKSLSRSIGFWLLLVVSLIATAIGGWLIAGQIGTMTTTLLDGTATGIEVYVDSRWWSWAPACWPRASWGSC